MIYQSISSLHRYLMNHEILPSELLQIYLQRIEEVNPIINALVARRFEQALAEAKKLDEQILKKKEFHPLFALPFTTKDMIAVTDMPYTLGMHHRRNKKANFDATVIRRLREKEALCVGLTNVPEIGLWYETYNVLYGRTSNPYNVTCTPGGSSGGEGALISSGGVVFGVGSDIGGSVRIPAFFCGLFAHKPSHGLIPFTGHYPMENSRATAFCGNKHPLTVIGPMARSAEDLAILLTVMAGPDGLDSEIQEYQQRDFQCEIKESWKGRKVFIISDPYLSGARTVSHDLYLKVKEAASILKELGAEIVELEEDLFREAFGLWRAVASAVVGPEADDRVINIHAANFLKEFLRLLTPHPHHTLPVLLTTLGEKFTGSKERMEKDFKQAVQLSEQLNKWLQPNNVLLFPPHSKTAPKHNEPLFHPLDFVYTGIFNALKLPVTQVPMGLDSEGLPLGVQIVGAKERDMVILAAAHHIEKATGGFVPPHI